MKLWRLNKDDLTFSNSLTSASLLHRMAANVMPLGVFLLKFLEWWYSSERSEVVRKLTSLPVPPPPEPIQPSPEGIRCPSSPELCPLCLNRRQEPTALGSSGWGLKFIHSHNNGLNSPLGCRWSTLILNVLHGYWHKNKKVVCGFLSLSLSPSSPYALTLVMTSIVGSFPIIL